MASERETYLRHAEAAEAKAAAATSPSIRRQFMELAEEWRRLAQPPERWTAPPGDDEAP
jgi:hypothetical protein